jgi:hypothetical protein
MKDNSLLNRKSINGNELLKKCTYSSLFIGDIFIILQRSTLEISDFIRTQYKHLSLRTIKHICLYWIFMFYVYNM